MEDEIEIQGSDDEYQRDASPRQDTLSGNAASRPLNRTKRFIHAALVILLLTLAILATRQNWWRLSPTDPLLEDCGKSPDEARRRGCHFDILSFAWQTPECYDHENSEAFRTHNGTWTYFADIGGPEQRTEEEVLKGDALTYVQYEYHRTHCTYMWRQLHRAYSQRGYIDEHLDNWNHTLHCQKVLLETRTPDYMALVNTRGKIIFPRCRKIW